MLKRFFLYLFDFFLFIWFMGPLRIAAAAASAAVIVTLTIIKPAPPVQAIAVYPPSLDLSNKVNGELSVSNRSEESHDVRIDLVSMMENTEECHLLYSPSFSTIPPHSAQIVRVMISEQNKNACAVNHKVIITDLRDPGFKAIEVPLSSSPAW